MKSCDCDSRRSAEAFWERATLRCEASCGKKSHDDTAGGVVVSKFGRKAGFLPKIPGVLLGLRFKAAVTK